MRWSTILLFALCVTMVVFFGRGVRVTYWTEPQPEAQAIDFAIPSGASVEQITQQLEDLGLLHAGFWFKVYGKLTGEAQRIQAGTFRLLPGLSIESLYAQLRAAQGDEQTLQLLEGWTIQEMSERVEAQGIATAETFRARTQDPVWRERFPFLQELPAGVDLEGYLYPDTYRFFTDADADTVITRLLETFHQRVVKEKAEDIAARPHTLFELVTIASLLEREVRSPEDMRRVADLIDRRLALGMPLQFDSTVNYVTGKNHPGILLSDREVDSPYNTYLHPGLPLGPISNPGAQAIDAALHPLANDALYFLTTPEGEVIYARTHDEHVQNKARYLR